MPMMEPGSPRQLAEALAASSAANEIIQLGGAFSKDAMGGPLPQGGVTISTRRLNRVRQYEPKDLTISVEAGLPYAELKRLLAENRQMVPLDPPFAASATVGGVVATNSSGPRRRLYGAARDMIIGMEFATLDGKVVQSGGMVVKNVAGLDMAKLLIGSFGTLAALAVVNFKLVPVPPQTRSFLLRHETSAEAIRSRDRILRGILQPAAIDLLNPGAAALCGRSGFLLAVQAGGSTALVDRYARELAGAEMLEGEAEEAFWRQVHEFVPRFLEANPGGAVVRLSRALSDIGSLLAAGIPVVARAGAGVAYVCYAGAKEAEQNEWGGVVEFAAPAIKKGLVQWRSPGVDFALMERIKRLFDPNNLLNPGRLYGRL